MADADAAGPDAGARVGGVVAAAAATSDPCSIGSISARSIVSEPSLPVSGPWCAGPSLCPCRGAAAAAGTAAVAVAVAAAGPAPLAAAAAVVEAAVLGKAGCDLPRCSFACIASQCFRFRSLSSSCEAAPLPFDARLDAALSESDRTGLAPTGGEERSVVASCRRSLFEAVVAREAVAAVADEVSFGTPFEPVASHRDFRLSEAASAPSSTAAVALLSSESVVAWCGGEAPETPLGFLAGWPPL